MKQLRARKWIAAALAGGFGLVTAASCDPYMGGFSFYRDDDYHGGYYYDDYWTVDYYYADCFYYDCY